MPKQFERTMNPQLITVTFDDVSQVLYRPASRYVPETTSFNFTANGKHEYAVTIWGKINIQKGMTVTALLREHGNWQTLMGWVDHDKGAIAGIRSPLLSVWYAALCILTIALNPIYLMPLFGVGKWDFDVGASILFFAALLLAIFNLSRAWKAWKALSMLWEFKYLDAGVS